MSERSHKKRKEESSLNDDLVARIVALPVGAWQRAILEGTLHTRTPHTANVLLRNKIQSSHSSLPTH